VRSFCFFQTLHRMFRACIEILLGPFVGICICTWLFRNLKASLAEHSPLFEGVQMTISSLLEETVVMFEISVAAVLLKILR